MDGGVLNPRILAAFPTRSSETLPELCRQLLHQQHSIWPQLIEGYAALREVRVRELYGTGFSIYLQFNPRRIASSGANVDPQSVGERRCFLCLDNLPPEQKGVLFADDFLVLCNPVPIFDKHLTIAHIKHIPQEIEGFISTFLELAFAMSPAFTVFYNGAKCGASAPDHLHFQAGPTGTIPVELEAAQLARRDRKKVVDAVSVYMLKDLGRQVIVIEGAGLLEVESVVIRLISATRQTLRTDEEPMMNILCSHVNGVWRVIVFLRRKHRPDVYFKQGEARVLISPAAVDIGGLVVVPIEKDFNLVDATMMQRIYDEVLLDKKTVEGILALV